MSPPGSARQPPAHPRGEREKELEVTQEGHQVPWVYRAGGTERDQRGTEGVPKDHSAPKDSRREGAAQGREEGWVGR